MTSDTMQLYYGLVTLTNTNEAFFYKDFEHTDGATYRVFNYRLASYTEFCLPSALECRGITFVVDEEGNPLRLVCRPMEKFFNVGEVSPDINTLAGVLIKQGRLSEHVYKEAKNQNI